MGTAEDLRTAFLGESQANRMYIAFARAAEQDGLPQIARLFRAAAEAETVHALAHFRAMEAIGATEENVRTSVIAEGYENKEMYPTFVAQAEREKNKAAALSFRYAQYVEGVHHDLFSKALKAVMNGKDLPARPIFVCNVCGNTVRDAVPDRCPNCGAAKKAFAEVE